MRNPKKSDVEVQICDNNNDVFIRFSIDIPEDEDWDSNRIDGIKLIGNDDSEWIYNCSSVILNGSTRITFSKVFPMSEEEIQKASFEISSQLAEPRLENLTLLLPVEGTDSPKKYRLTRNNVFQTFRWVKPHE